MGHLHLAIESRTDAEVQVGALVAHRVLRVDTHDAALAVGAVEGTLRTAEHVDAVEHIEVGVIGRLRHQGDMVVVDAHGGVVHSRADAADVHRRGETAAVGGHRKRGHVVGQLTETAHIQLLHLPTAEGAARHRLLTEEEPFLRLGDHYYFVEVDHPTRIGGHHRMIQRRGRTVVRHGGHAVIRHSIRSASHRSDGGESYKYRYKKCSFHHFSKFSAKV